METRFRSRLVTWADSWTSIWTWILCWTSGTCSWTWTWTWSGTATGTWSCSCGPSGTGSVSRTWNATGSASETGTGCTGTDCVSVNGSCSWIECVSAVGGFYCGVHCAFVGVHHDDRSESLGAFHNGPSEHEALGRLGRHHPWRPSHPRRLVCRGNEQKRSLCSPCCMDLWGYRRLRLFHTSRRHDEESLVRYGTSSCPLSVKSCPQLRAVVYHNCNSCLQSKCPHLER